MAEEMGIGCGSCSRNNEVDNDCLCVSCTRGGQQCLPNNPNMITPQMRANMRPLSVSKTRGVPSQGSLEYGPRGQRQSFRGFTGTNWQQSGRNRETMWQNGGVFSNAIGATQSNSGCEGQCGNVNGVWYGSCATCGPGCNCDCINGKCTKVARKGSKVRAGGYSRFAGDSNGTMKTMSVGRLVMGYLAIGLTAFVIGYAIKKGCETAK